MREFASRCRHCGQIVARVALSRDRSMTPAEAELARELLAHLRREHPAAYRGETSDTPSPASGSG